MFIFLLHIQAVGQSGHEHQLQSINLSEETSEQETATTTVQLMPGGQTLQVRMPAYQQAITLPDGTTAFLQQPVLASASKGKKIVTRKLDEEGE